MDDIFDVLPHLNSLLRCFYLLQFPLPIASRAFHICARRQTPVLSALVASISIVNLSRPLLNCQRLCDLLTSRQQHREEIDDLLPACSGLLETNVDTVPCIASYNNSRIEGRQAQRVLIFASTTVQFPMGMRLPMVVVLEILSCPLQTMRR